ncbi:MAG TPA: hypothetical protein DDY43_12050 [Synechococcales bacterium UBA10510]|nr:hypothetical protein [Synechococcales bacterium UBA10510]
MDPSQDELNPAASSAPEASPPEISPLETSDADVDSAHTSSSPTSGLSGSGSDISASDFSSSDSSYSAANSSDSSAFNSLEAFPDFPLVGAAVRLRQRLPYLKTADPMPMLRPPDLIDAQEVGQVVAIKPLQQRAVRFRRGTFLLAAANLELAGSAES